MYSERKFAQSVNIKRTIIVNVSKLKTLHGIFNDC